jgi:hypothetical protein
MTKQSWLVVCLTALFLGFIAGDRFRRSFPQIEKPQDHSTIHKTTGIPVQPGPIFHPVQGTVQENTNIVNGSQTDPKEKARLRAEAFKERMLAVTAAKREAEYAPFLVDLGLDASQIQQVLSNLTSLHRQAIPAGETMLELLMARYKYDQQMRSILGPDGYEKYREFEEAKPFRREIEDLKSSALSDRVLIDGVSERKLLGLIQEHGLQTKESWDGPYDPEPSPQVGFEAHIADNQSKIATITNGLALVRTRPEWHELPRDVSDATLKYFENIVKRLDEGIQSSRMSPEERMKRELDAMSMRRAGKGPGN